MARSCGVWVDTEVRSMRRMTDRDDLDRRLRAANRVPGGVAPTPAFRVRLDEIRLRARSGPRDTEPHTRRRLPVVRRGVVLASVVGVVAVAGAAAATIIATDTIGAPGYCQTITNETSGIPFPSGYQSWQDWTMLLEVGPKPGTTLNDLCDPAAGAHIADNGAPGTYETPAETAQASFARAAFCAWADDWLKAEADGDSATESRAAGEIAGALQWPGSEVANPAQSHISSTKIVFRWFIPVQSAVQAGDTAPVAWQFDPQAANSGGGQCQLATPPADSDGGTLVP